MIDKLILKNRSYRRFFQDHLVDLELLTELVNLARISPSGGNMQNLRFYLSNDQERNKIIFPCLAWAGYLKDWAGPEEGEEPSAYIILLADRSAKKPVEYDAGIAVQSMLLGAVEHGLGGCIIGSVKREKLQKELSIPENLRIVLVIALGKPKEEVVIENMVNDDVKYWRDEMGVHHVPKRRLDDLIVDVDPDPDNYRDRTIGS